MNDAQKNELITLIDKFSSGDGIHKTAVPGLSVIKMSAVNLRIPTVYDPSLCVIVQGRKQVLLEQEIYRYAPSEYLCVSVELPVTGQITQASPEQPYLCLQIDLDQNQISDLLMQIQKSPVSESRTMRGIFVGKMDDNLSDSILRFARLLENPQDILFLAPMILREIYYYLLRGAHGATIAQAATNGSNMQKMSAILQKIKKHYDRPLCIEDLAKQAGMSLSSFHAHFKQITATSPLQYQKRLRLLEARRIMLSGGLDAATAAHQVGYESASQFSREYAREFGHPPMRDIEMLRMLSDCSQHAATRASNEI